MVKRTVVITGGTGKVGLHLVQSLLKEGYHVHVLAHLQPAAEHPLLRENISLTVMDLTTLPEAAIQQWLDVVRPQALIHLAALADVRGCERQPALAYLLNVSTTRMLARSCAARAVHCILLSTEYVFDGMLAPGLLYAEGDAANPLNHYGKSKVWAERVVQRECAQKTRWTICRTSMVYGSLQKNRPDFVQWVRTKLQQNETFQVARDQINSPTFGIDLARMLVAVLERRLEGVYHVAGSTPISRYRFALSVARHCGLNEALIQPVLTSQLEIRPRRPLNASLCVSKITTATGISPMSLEEGLARACFADSARKKTISTANSFEKKEQ